ncbi:hypothetical protein [Actinoplanes sp. NPDC049599]|uniref:hypothetical protein n=1 Tax=Actinoplanes sp. NPDC049599 TaxID=3363903 RepID=UPI0037B9484E
MGVDYFWRRVAEGDVDGLGAAELYEVVPYWFDASFEYESDAGITVGTTDTAALMDKLLRLGAGGGADAESAWLTVDGADGVEDDMVGVLTGAQVVAVADFLSRAQPATWVHRFRAELSDTAQDVGYSRPFDDEWAQALVRDTEELTALFAKAASANESVIVKVVA